MESNFNNRDFEQFVKQNADQYRMYPSEKVWGGINKALHTRRRWYGIGLALLLLLTGAGVALVMMTTSNKTKEQSTLLSPPVIEYNELLQDESNSTTEAIAKSGPIDFSKAKTARQSNNDSDDPTVFDELLAAQGRKTTPATEAVVITVPVANDNTNAPKEEVLIAVNTPVLAKKITKPSAEAKQAVATIAATPVTTTVRDEDMTAADETKKKTETTSPANNILYPLTIESVVNSFKAKPRKTLSWQVHISPTVSYRRLSENKGFLQEAALNGYIPIVSAYGEAKDFVIHKPDFGLEIGVAARYPLTKNIKIKAGLQFNVSRYDIKAYKFDREIATINLDQGSGNSSITTSTVYRTRTRSNDGTNWLQNLYYSASLPVGVEYSFASRKSTHFGVAATIQPTYVISNRAYLLSTDYKNYVEIPSLTRRVNLNTGIEAFVSYKAKNGATRWQIGPQVRYQLKSSFINTYPVKENLFDFGLKVGVILNNK